MRLHKMARKIDKRTEWKVKQQRHTHTADGQKY